MPRDPEVSLLERLAERAPAILTLTEALVRVNSHTRNVAGVDAVARLLQAALAGTGLELIERPAPELGMHLCFETKQARQAPAILLVGHHDTVFPEGSFEGFRCEGTRAFGPGVLDMKGGLAIIVSVLSLLDEARLLGDLPLRFISVSDEEIGSPSGRPFLEELAQGAACALVFEAGRAGDRLITARRGSGFALLDAAGKAAHAGNALAEGRNAIWVLARFVDHAQRLNGQIPGASLNVGLVRGGTARNTVPDRAHCELDLRFSDASGERALHDALQAARQRAEQEVPGTRLSLEITTSRKPWVRSAGSVELCQRYGACQLAAGLSAGETDTIGGGSDANTVGALGIAAIDGLGPRGTGFHTLDEQIEIPSLHLKAEALLRFLLAWDGESSLAPPYKNERA